MDIRQLAIVEGEGMRRLINYFELGYCLPSRKHVTKLLCSKYGRGGLILKEKLAQGAAPLALTSDIWTSNTMEAYISLTAHSISPAWEMQSCVLHTKAFPEHHTGWNIADCTEEMVKSFNIDTK